MKMFRRNISLKGFFKDQHGGPVAIKISKKVNVNSKYAIKDDSQARTRFDGATA